MSAAINEAVFQVGTFGQRNFSKDCEIGDTETFQTTGFQRVVFPEQFPDQSSVRVIVTANNLGVPTGTHSAALVGAVQDVTVEGFILKARNSDCADEVSLAGMNWMAVAETPGVAGSGSLIVDTGEVVSQNFFNNCSDGDTKAWEVYFSRPFLTPPIILVTANDGHLVGHSLQHQAFPVGMARSVTPYGFTLVGRNSDCFTGDGGLFGPKIAAQAGFYWVAIGCALGCG